MVYSGTNPVRFHEDTYNPQAPVLLLPPWKHAGLVFSRIGACEFGWWGMKRGTGRHEKLLELACELNIPLYAAVGIMNLLWEWAAESKPRGDIGRASNRVIATMVGWPVEDSERLIQTLVQVRLVDAIDGADRLVIHDWADHCDNGVHTYLARRGLYFACGKPPSLNHLRGDERASLSAQYGSKKGPKKGPTKVQAKTWCQHGRYGTERYGPFPCP